ncbi:hypothetical protein COO60DRAFT_727094 [Scenedesmus sp. NREL 46B-D3]|nr:hypothetical protein COO60DRAFT_727094 [Scenedesmus sp. NREL 46B-D3]
MCQQCCMICFQPSSLKVTTMESPGVLVLNDTFSNSSIGVEQVQHDAETEALPFQSGSMDAVFFLEVLKHLQKDPFFAMLKMHRVLKPNGTLFLSTPNLGSFSALARLHDGWGPNAYSKYLSNQDGQGLHHTRAGVYLAGAGTIPGGCRLCSNPSML